MNKYGLAVALVFSSCIYGQTAIINQDLTDSTKNAFYIGVDNRIKLQLPGKEEHYSIVVKGAGSSIAKTGSKEYCVRVSAIDTCKIEIYKNNKIVLIKKYNTYTIPPLIATLQYLKDTSATVSRVLLNPYLRIVVPGAYYRVDGAIVSFSTTFVKYGDSTVMSCTGNTLCPEQKKFIQTLISGDTIWFNEIRGHFAGGRTVKFPPFWIKIE